MNHHAAKVDYDADESQSDPVYGGALKQVYQCPKCGHIELVSTDY